MIGLATDGYYGSGGTNDGDTDPPVIAPISPLPAIAPGNAGGFPPDYATASLTPIIIDITDLDPGLQLVTVMLRYDANEPEQIVYRQGVIRTGFAAESAVITIGTGIEVVILPDDLWPSGGTDPSFVLIDIDATDLVGNVTTASFVYQLPPVSPSTLEIPAAAPGSLDHTAAALGRLREQFRSFDTMIVRTVPAGVAATMSIESGFGTILKLTARMSGVSGNSIQLANDDSGGAEPPIVSDSGLVVSLSSANTSTFAEVAAAVNSGSGLISAVVIGNGTESFSSVAGLFSGTLAGGSN